MVQREYHFYVYILASRSRSLYVGFTNDIRFRIKQHREKRLGSHTAKFNIGRLVHYEHFTYVLNAVAREKELKDWNRPRKIALIDQQSNLERLGSRLGLAFVCPAASAIAVAFASAFCLSFRPLFVIPQRSGGICCLPKRRRPPNHTPIFTTTYKILPQKPQQNPMSTPKATQLLVHKRHTRGIFNPFHPV